MTSLFFMLSRSILISPILRQTHLFARPFAKNNRGGDGRPKRLGGGDQTFQGLWWSQCNSSPEIKIPSGEHTKNY